MGLFRTHVGRGAVMGDALGREIMARFATLDNLPVSGKTVIVRSDLNVPMEGGRITDATRINRLLPTLRELSAAGAKVVVLSHLGRPKDKFDPSLSLSP